MTVTIAAPEGLENQEHARDCARGKHVFTKRLGAWRCSHCPELRNRMGQTIKVVE